MGWGESTDQHEARDILGIYRDAGGTLIDTAWAYGDGSSETLVGQLLAEAGARDDVVLATKAGLLTRGDRRRDASRRTLLNQLDQSLERLQTDHIDLWQVHIWDDATPLQETLSALSYAVQSGRARYVGVSNYNGWQTAYAHTLLASRAEPLILASTQIEYSLLNRAIEAEVDPAVDALGMGMLAWSPLGRGVLTGKYRHGIPGDSRAATSHMDRFVTPYLEGTSRSIVEAVARAADGLQLSCAEVALAWVLGRPGVTSAIIGARTATQLKGSLQAEQVTLPPAIVQALDDVSEVAR
ncbi:aldo/keto reductase [soil metagenome]